MGKTPSRKSLPKEISLNSTEVDDESIDSASESHHTASSEDLRGLRQSLQRQLLLDIESRGGLFAFKISRLCNEKPDVYGEKNSVLRRQVQNAVTYWKTLNREKFEDLKRQLLTTGILSSPTVLSPPSNFNNNKPASKKPIVGSPHSQPKTKTLQKSPSFFCHQTPTTKSTIKTDLKMDDIGPIRGKRSMFWYYF